MREGLKSKRIQSIFSLYPLTVFGGVERLFLHLVNFSAEGTNSIN